MIGITGNPGIRCASDSQLRQDRIHHRVMRRDFHVDPAGEDVPLAGRVDDGVDSIGGSGDHSLARRGVHRHRHAGVVGDQ